jgi:hypothetical protein
MIPRLLNSLNEFAVSLDSSSRISPHRTWWVNWARPMHALVVIVCMFQIWRHIRHPSLQRSGQSLVVLLLYSVVVLWTKSGHLLGARRQQQQQQQQQQ